MGKTLTLEGEIGSILTGTGLFIVATGLRCFFEYAMDRDSIIDALYARASEINPEVIQQTSKLVSETSAYYIYSGTFHFISGGVMLALGYKFLNKKE